VKFADLSSRTARVINRVLTEASSARMSSSYAGVPGMGVAETFPMLRKGATVPGAHSAAPSVSLPLPNRSILELLAALPVRRQSGIETRGNIVPSESGRPAATRSTRTARSGAQSVFASAPLSPCNGKHGPHQDRVHSEKSQSAEAALMPSAVIPTARPICSQYPYSRQCLSRSLSSTHNPKEAKHASAARNTEAVRN